MVGWFATTPSWFALEVVRPISPAANSDLTPVPFSQGLRGKTHRHFFEEVDFMSNVSSNVQAGAARPEGALTVEALAQAKKLPAAFLRQLGLCDLPADRAVGIPYYDETAAGLLMKRRTALIAKEGSHWPSSVPVCAYGRWRIAEAAKQGMLIVVEGESDCWTLWHHGLPALGLPGSGMAKTLTGEHLAGVQKVYVFVEPDRGGRTFRTGVIERLAELQYDGQTFILTLPDGYKDPSDLHIAAPELFLKRFQWALKVALPAAPKTAEENPTQVKREPQVVNLADVTVEEVHWLWPGRIPLGKLTIFDGDPGLGKSTVTLDIAARLTRGLPMPGAPVESALPPSSVLLLTAEDGLGDTIRPRLEAAGACLKEITALQGFAGADGILLPISLPMDVPTTAQIVEVSGAKLVVIDPLMAFLHESVQSNSDQSVRRALLPLTRLADISGAAIVVVRHLNKQSNKNINYRGGGSIGILGVARSALIACKDPDAANERLLGVSKSNLCKPPGPLRYEIIPAGTSSRVVWLGGSDADIEKLLAMEEKTESNAGHDADEFLKERLAQGPVPAPQIFAEAAELHISESALRRAKKRLRVTSRFIAAADRHGGHWMWCLPAPSKPEPAE
jgi:hypothetical protein